MGREDRADVGTLQMKFQWSKDPYEQLLQIAFWLFFTPGCVYVIRLYLNYGYALLNGYWAYEP